VKTSAAFTYSTLCTFLSSERILSNKILAL
jgi:hypothetical protein